MSKNLLVIFVTCLFYLGPLYLVKRADAHERAMSFCERIGYKKYDFCGEYSYGIPSGSLEIRGLPSSWNATKRRTEYRLSAARSLRVAVSNACCMNLRIWGNKKSWVFHGSSTIKTVRIPRGTYSMCFNDMINSCGSNSWSWGFSWYYYYVPDSNLLSRYNKPVTLIVY